MAVPMCSRALTIRSLTYINNGIIGAFVNNLQHLTTLRLFTSATENNIPKDLFIDNTMPEKKMSKAMKAYLMRAKEHEAFMKKQIAEYEIGKRHLANMMGENPDTFTQADIDRAVQYLFPSGLFEPRARPSMKHPKDVFPSRKAAEFDETGRPFHSLFYTTKPNYNEILHNILGTMYKLNDEEDKLIQQGNLPQEQDKFDTIGSAWKSKEELENLLLETLKDAEYDNLVKALDRLAAHPLSARVADFLMKYRNEFSLKVDSALLPPLEYDANGRPFITVKQCMRKSTRGEVTLWGNGSGNITINGQDILYFQDMQCREQVIFPLIFTGMVDKLDVEATMVGGGPTGQAGAMRWGIAWGLQSFVDEKMRDRMRMAGLLTRDWRRRERKKPGQEGARRKFTWKKR